MFPTSRTARRRPTAVTRQARPHCVRSKIREIVCLKSINMKRVKSELRDFTPRRA